MRLSQNEPSILSGPIILTTATLAIFAGVVGYLAGKRSVPTETQVITRAAQLYTDATGGDPTDCAGRPGAGEIWIAVTCGTGTDAPVFLFDHTGALIPPSEEPST